MGLGSLGSGLVGLGLVVLWVGSGVVAGCVLSVGCVVVAELLVVGFGVSAQAVRQRKIAKANTMLKIDFVICLFIRFTPYQFDGYLVYLENREISPTFDNLIFGNYTIPISRTQSFFKKKIREI